MRLPFTHAEFLDVFAAYNAALWPVAALLWLLTAWTLVAWMRKGQRMSRYLAALLAAHWAWSALGYHWAFFRHINPAAGLFAVLFMVQAALFVWFGVVRQKLRVRLQRSFRGAVASGLLVYGLVYPAIGLAFGLRYPRMPVFGVPCPTTLLTAGVLLLALPGWPRLANVIPIVWTAVGGSAAFLLGVQADFALFVAGGFLLLQTVVPARVGASRRETVH